MMSSKFIFLLILLGILAFAGLSFVIVDYLDEIYLEEEPPTRTELFVQDLIDKTDKDELVWKGAYEARFVIEKVYNNVITKGTMRRTFAFVTKYKGKVIGLTEDFFIAIYEEDSSDQDVFTELERSSIHSEELFDAINRQEGRALEKENLKKQEDFLDRWSF